LSRFPKRIITLFINSYITIDSTYAECVKAQDLKISIFFFRSDFCPRCRGHFQGCVGVARQP